jgi:DNA polymerase (family 10)
MEGARSHNRAMADGLPTNEEVAARLELLADLLELEGESSFRVVAYRRAAGRIRETPESIAELAIAGKAKELPGIGTIIEEKIVQLVEQGEIEAIAKRKDRIPPGLVEILRVPGLGPKTAKRIWDELGVTTLDELKEAAEAQRLRRLTGVGARLEEKILQSLDDAS